MQCVVPKEMAGHHYANSGHLRVVGLQMTLLSFFLLEGRQAVREGRRKLLSTLLLHPHLPFTPQATPTPPLARFLSSVTSLQHFNIVDPVPLKYSLPSTSMTPFSPLWPLWSLLLSQFREISFLFPSSSSEFCPQTFPFLNLIAMYVTMSPKCPSCALTRHLYLDVPWIHQTRHGQN